MTGDSLLPAGADRPTVTGDPAPRPGGVRQALGDLLVVAGLAALVVVAVALGVFVGRVTPVPRLAAVFVTGTPAVAATAHYFRRRVAYWRGVRRLRRRK